MNLTGQSVYKKGQRLKKKPNRPTAAQKRRWDKIAAMGCIIGNSECRGAPTIHHCGTQMGCRKDHDKTVCLCERHHTGDLGVDGKKVSFPEWERRYGTEQELLEETERRLAHGREAV